MSVMFKKASMFNEDISKWETLKVINMESMFEDAENFNQNINTKLIKKDESPIDEEYIAWDTSKVIFMENIFNGAKKFNGNILKWNTSKIEDLDFKKIELPFTFLLNI